jgi:hypothetical protein
MATREDNLNERVINISRAIAACRRLKLRVTAYIPSLAAVEAFQAAEVWACRSESNVRSALSLELL